jgi:hypothetical protein
MQYGASADPNTSETFIKASSEAWRRCVALRGRVRLVIEVLQAGVLAGLGLTPLGARFIHGVAPDGSAWKAAAAWLVIAVPLAAAQAPRHRRRAARRGRAHRPPAARGAGA